MLHTFNYNTNNIIICTCKPDLFQYTLTNIKQWNIYNVFTKHKWKVKTMSIHSIITCINQGL